MTPPAPYPPDEPRRLDRLRALSILDTGPEAVFDVIARTASAVCDTPIALVSLIDADRQWCKANVGLPDHIETPREITFCAHALLDGNVTEVPDATCDPRFANNPFVLDTPRIRFYAGAPISMPEGERVGTVCVMDRQARRLSATQRATLNDLAALASHLLVTRETMKAHQGSEARYRALIEDQRDMVSLATPDGVLVFVNPAYAQHVGSDAAALVGTSLYNHVPVDERGAVAAHVRAVLEDGEQTEGENRIVSADGSMRWIAWTNRRVADPGGRALLHSVGRDISARKAAEAALAESEARLKEAAARARRSEDRLRAIADTLPMRVSYVDAEGRYVFNNLAYEAAFGTPRDGLHGRTVREVLGEEAYRRVEPWIRRALAGERVNYTIEVATDGVCQYQEVTYIPDVSADGQRVLGFQAVISDVTKATLEARRLLRLAQVDPVTGIANRAGFEERLAQAVAVAQDLERPIALMYLDVDHFKKVNDTHGHFVGDLLLKSFAARLVRALRVSDLIARLGGDEFVILLEHVTSEDQVERIADKILASMREPFLLDDRSVPITTSIGFVHYRGQASVSPESLIARADRAMYQAKSAGRNTWKAAEDTA